MSLNSKYIKLYSIYFKSIVVAVFGSEASEVAQYLTHTNK